MYSKKTKTLEELSEIIKEEKKIGKTVVHSHGCFDLVHYGHLMHFLSAKNLGDILVITVTEDRFVNKGQDRPFFTQEQRRDYLSAFEMVDYVAINRWPSSAKTIRLLKPNIYVKGVEYKNIEDDLSGRIIHEINAIEAVGGKIAFTDEVVYSSTQLINNSLK